MEPEERPGQPPRLHRQFTKLPFQLFQPGLSSQAQRGPAKHCRQRHDQDGLMTRPHCSLLRINHVSGGIVMITELTDSYGFQPQQAPQFLDLRGHVANADGAMMCRALAVPFLDEPPRPGAKR